MEEVNYIIGDKVRKISGDYQLDGVVIAVGITSRGKVRYMVEHEPGFLHIYSDANLQLRERTTPNYQFPPPIGHDLQSIATSKT